MLFYTIYNMNLSKQKIILIDGPTGSGKTTTAGLLNKKLKHTAFLGRDRIKWFVPDFSRLCKKDIITADRAVVAMCKEYLDSGASVVVEQCFRREHVIRLYLDLLKNKKIPLLAYELTAPKEILIGRVNHRPYMWPGKKNLPIWLIWEQLSAYPHKNFVPVRLKFDSSKLSARQIASRIIKDIKEA